jgi:nucleolar protein 12
MAIDEALLLDGKKMAAEGQKIPGDRKLRVTRAKNIKRRDANKPERRPEPRAPKAVYIPKVDPKKKDTLGRARKLLGRAGAAQLKAHGEVFEGLRASANTDSGIKKGGSGKKKGKPRARSSARAAAWKAKKK